MPQTVIGRIDPARLEEPRKVLFETLKVGSAIAAKIGSKTGTFWRYFSDRPLPSNKAWEIADIMDEFAADLLHSAAVLRQEALEAESAG